MVRPDGLPSLCPIKALGQSWGCAVAFFASCSCCRCKAAAAAAAEAAAAAPSFATRSQSKASTKTVEGPQIQFIAETGVELNASSSSAIHAASELAPAFVCRSPELRVRLLQRQLQLPPPPASPLHPLHGRQIPQQQHDVRGQTHSGRSEAPRGDVLPLRRPGCQETDHHN